MEKQLKPKHEMMKKNQHKRLGGMGLSLEAFANAKSKDNQYNPAIIKKQRELYRNAKHVSKYKKFVKKEGEKYNTPRNISISEEELKPQVFQRSEQDEGELRSSKEKRRKKKVSQSLMQEYEKKRQEEEKARAEREAIAKAKREDRERVEAQRKALKEKMLKKTRSGQPVMKYRLEHLLQGIQNSSN
ncbi:hypothetical protein AMTRI_Chr02g222030 [Amborella trichopoda]|uniref:rRNA-processing protein FYV7 n=1 Tax=Amborella trichopoda TaxID=13333 RepID=U5D3B1_AMBTC|nr:rRNA-processing protein FYV7 [Amborella trichopoda]ERN16914.1 hypothetical protein AMTR_s00057p00172490 [Amborella trichopoda]|eukprot:XP_006855447.1 rRNA-processing protein FYV7 [Amborella trichopoda]